MSAPAKSSPDERNRPEVEAAWRAVPAHQVGEIVGGVLHTMPRPARRHTVAASNLGEELGPPFKRGRGGPGGWVLLDEPELHLGGGPDILVPDLAGCAANACPTPSETRTLRRITTSRPTGHARCSRRGPRRSIAARRSRSTRASA